LIDLHSHILPGIDDGPAELEGSLALARAAVATGTHTIAATPHIDASYNLMPGDRDRPMTRLVEAIRAEGLPLTVVWGAEIALDRYLDLSPEEIDSLRLGDGEYLLLECPLSQAAGAFDRFLASLLTRGVPMMLAHPERCPDFQRQPERLAMLVSGGAIAQVTSGSLAGRFGRTVQSAALHMLAEGLVHDLSSDAHDATGRGPDLQLGLDAAAQALPGSGALADWLAVDVPDAVISGKPIPRRPPVSIVPPRSKRLRLFGRK
jgi:protein-tyrosine phosphatase